MTPSFSFKLFYDFDRFKNKTAVKMEIHDGQHWLKGNELSTAAQLGKPIPIAAMVDNTFNLCVKHGLDASQKDRFWGRKRVTLKGTDVPLNELVADGWSIEQYPLKYQPPEMVNHAAVLADARKHGAHVDVSNAVCDEETAATNGLALKGIVNLLRDNSIPTRLYVDYSLFGWLKYKGMTGAYDYLNGLLNDHGPGRMITESGCGESVDPILLDWTDASNGHVISKDCFDDYDMAYDWILRGAEKGSPRLHRFSCDGNCVSIPDLGLSTKIPSSF